MLRKALWTAELCVGFLVGICLLQLNARRRQRLRYAGGWAFCCDTLLGGKLG